METNDYDWPNISVAKFHEVKILPQEQVKEGEISYFVLLYHVNGAKFQKKKTFSVLTSAAELSKKNYFAKHVTPKKSLIIFSTSCFAD